jgi:hypothetical protein
MLIHSQVCGVYGNCYEDGCLGGTVASGRELLTFQRNLIPLSSGDINNLLHYVLKMKAVDSAKRMLFYSSTLTMDQVCSSEPFDNVLPDCTASYIKREQS